ncbi:MAG: HEAT repeat domain-containing protein [Verrucomicrobiae bacterium]|nr:HEAT repeat domain-containing protein [Verrucomicrobiae bacterium]
MKSPTRQRILAASGGLVLAACWLVAEERAFDNNFAEVAAVVEEMRGISMQQPAMAQNQSTPESRRSDRIDAMLRAFGTKAVPAVAAALADPDVGMRRNAALVLIDLNAPWSRKPRVDTTGAIPALIRAMDDPDAHVRAWAAHAIEPMGPAGAPAVPALIRLLSDPDEGPRNDSAIALRAIGAAAKSALPALRRNLEDPMKDPRNFARRAIEAIEADIVREKAPPPTGKKGGVK